jgi:hypothetical protein
MPNSAPPRDGLEAIEMTSSGNVVPEFPAEMLAKAWLDEHSQPLTWADL